jgi:hypothetical protein
MASLSSTLAALRSENEELRARILDLESDLELRDERIETLESEMRCFMDIASFDSNGQQSQSVSIGEDDPVDEIIGSALEELCISSPVLSVPLDGDKENKELAAHENANIGAISVETLYDDAQLEEERALILSPEIQQKGSARDSIMDTRRVTLSHFKDFSSPEKLVQLFTELNENADEALYAQSSPSEIQSKHLTARRRASTNIHPLPAPLTDSNTTGTGLTTISCTEDKNTRRSSLGHINTDAHSSQVKNFNKRLSLTPTHDSDDSGFLEQSVFYDVASPKSEYPQEDDDEDDLDLDGTIHGHGKHSNQASPRHMATDTSLLSLDEHSPSSVNNSPTNFVDTHSQVLKTPGNKTGGLQGLVSPPSGSEDMESSESDVLISSMTKKRADEVPPEITYSTFLHRILMPSSSDLASTVQRFLLSIAGNNDNSTSVQSFLNNDDDKAHLNIHNHSNEMSNKCSRFFDSMEAQIRTHASWRAETEDNVKCIRDHLETYVFLQIYPYAYATVEREYAEEEASVYKKMLILSQFLAPRNLDVDYPELQRNDSLYKIAGEELRKMNRHTIPSEKMACIIRSASLVSRVLSVVRLKHGHSVHSGADDFLPLFIYVVLKSKARNLVLNCEYISAFYNPTRLMGMAGYTLMNLRSALQFINEMSSGDISHMSVSEFETNFAIFEKRIEAKLAKK